MCFQSKPGTHHTLALRNIPQPPLALVHAHTHRQTDAVQVFYQ